MGTWQDSRINFQDIFYLLDKEVNACGVTVIFIGNGLSDSNRVYGFFNTEFIINLFTWSSIKSKWKNPSGIEIKKAKKLKKIRIIHSSLRMHALYNGNYGEK